MSLLKTKNIALSLTLMKLSKYLYISLFVVKTGKKKPLINIDYESTQAISGAIPGK